jgi:hypothetical protein
MDACDTVMSPKLDGDALNWSVYYDLLYIRISVNVSTTLKKNLQGRIFVRKVVGPSPGWYVTPGR